MREILRNQQAVNRQLANIIERKGGIDNLTDSDIARLYNRYVKPFVSSEMSEFTMAYSVFKAMLHEHAMATECHIGDTAFFTQDAVADDIQPVKEQAVKCLELAKAVDASFYGVVVKREFDAKVSHLKKFMEV